MIAAFAVRIRRSHLARHGLLVFAGVVSANAFIYVYYAFVARIVGVAGYGAVSALFSAVLLVGTPPTTVGATIVARLAAELHAAGEFGRLRALGAAVMRVSLSAAAAMFAICAALAQPIAGYLHLNSVAPVLLGAVILALSLIVPLQRALLQGTHSFSAFAVSNLVEAIAKMIAGPFLALSWGVNGALAGFCIGFLVSVLYNAFAFARLDYPRGHALRLGFKATVRSSVGLALAMLMLNIVLFYDVILVRHYFTPFVAGLYGVAVLAGRAVYNIIYFLPTIVLPKAVARAASGASSGSLLAVALAIGAIITLGAAAVAAVEPRSILLLLSGR